MPSPKNWTPTQTLATFHLYLGESFGRLHSRNPDIITLASALNRTPSAVAMKACNFAALDPALDRKGLSGASAQDKQLWQDFANNPAQVLLQARDAYTQAMETTQAQVGANEEDFLLAGEDARAPIPTETTATVKVRLTQALFRRTVLAAYGASCAISGLNIPTLLVASHIIPWAHDEKRRADPRNGIALSSLHDKAFDRGLLSFDADHRLILSTPLRLAAQNNPTGETCFLKPEGHPLRLPERFLPDPAALAWHRAHVFKAA